MHRWKQIERLCGFNIINNSGLQFLESTLYRNANGRPGTRGTVLCAYLLTDRIDSPEVDCDLLGVHVSEINVSGHLFTLGLEIFYIWQTDLSNLSVPFVRRFKVGIVVGRLFNIATYAYGLRVRIK